MACHGGSHRLGLTLPSTRRPLKVAKHEYGRALWQSGHAAVTVTQPTGRLTAVLCGLSSELVGGPRFEPGASRSRISRDSIHPCRFLRVSVRIFRSGRLNRPDLGQSSAGLLHEVLHGGVTSVWDRRSAGLIEPSASRDALQQLAIRSARSFVARGGWPGPGASGRQAAGWLKVPISRAKPRMCVLMVNPTTAARTLGGRFKLRTSNAYTVS